MMDVRPIDANALKEFYGKWSNKHTEFLKPEVDRYIDSQPTLDYEPVRHGEWVEEGLLTWCSRCLNSPLYDYFGKIKKAHYCPNCGAKMDGGNRNE